MRTFACLPRVAVPHVDVDAAVIGVPFNTATSFRSRTLFREDLVFVAGDAPPPVVETPLGHIGVAVCYDIEFPEWVRLDETGVLRASSHAPEFASPWSRRCAVLWVGARGPEFRTRRTRRAGLRRPAVRQPVTSAPHARDDLSLAADRMRRHGPSHEPACSTSRPSRGCQGMRAPAKVLVAHGDLLALELEVDGRRTNATAGAPVESSMVVLYGDNRAEIGVRSCTPGAFPGAKDGITEHMLVLASDATITGDDGTSVELRAGVSCVMPDGWMGRWEGRHTLVKQYTIWRTAPTDASA